MTESFQVVFYESNGVKTEGGVQVALGQQFVKKQSVGLLWIMFHTLTYEKNILPTCTKRKHVCNTCPV